MFFLSFQVLFRSSNDEPFGWWPARLKDIKGDFVVVNFSSDSQEIVTISSIRPKSVQQ